MARRVQLIAGEPIPGESRKAILACNDYLRMGAGRSLSILSQQYSKIERVQAPTQSLGTLFAWSTRYGWQTRAELYDAELERQRNEAEAARRKEIMESGFALDYERVAALKRLAALLLNEIDYTDGDDRPKVWLPDVKQIGAGETAERVDIVRFNSPLIEQLRGTLDDLAKEVGGRVTKQEHSGPGGGAIPIKHEYDDQQYDRAITTLSDALGSLLRPASGQPDSPMDTPEQAAMDGAADQG